MKAVTCARMSAVFCFAVLVSLFAVSPLSAQWETDLRLTNDAGYSFTSQNNAWCVAAAGDTLHATWFDDRDGARQIYYKRSTSGGTNWGTDTRLINTVDWAHDPSIAASGLNVHVGWIDQRDRNTEIYYMRSTNGGTNWGTDVRLTNDTAYTATPSVAVSGNYVHVAWIDRRPGNQEIYYKRSTDNGANWGADTRLTNDADMSWFPSVAVSGSNVHMVWQDYRNNNYEVYYKRSQDNGATWGADTRLTNSAAWSWYPAAAVSGSSVHVVWFDSTPGNWEIYYKRSTDGGTTWGADTRLTNTPLGSTFPSVAASGSNVHVTWMDSLGGRNHEIYYKRSPDGGATWSADVRLTNDPASSYYPSVAASGARVHVVWSDDRNGNYELYYKRNPTGNIGIEEEKSVSFLHPLSLPAVFRNRIVLRFSTPSSMPLKLAMYDLTGQQLFERSYSSIPASIILQGAPLKKLPAGIYFLKLDSEPLTGCNKIIKVE